MFKQKREKLIEACNLKKNCQDKPFVQLEGELTEAQLEAIAGGKLSQN